MKHLRFIVMMGVSLLCASQGSAQQRAVREARTIAADWFDRHIVQNQALDFQVEETAGCYVLKQVQTDGRQSPGYVVVAKDKRLPAVLAYSHDGTFRQDGLPAHIAYWLEGYEAMAEASASRPGLFEAWLSASRLGHVDVAPLLGDMAWGQDDPYNVNCPQVDGKKTPTGCVATALAQVLHHNRWPDTFNWAGMRDNYGPSEITGATEGDTVIFNQRYRMSDIYLDRSQSVRRCYVAMDKLLTIESFEERNGNVALVLLDGEDHFLQRVSERITFQDHLVGIVLQQVRQAVAIPSTLPDGDYRLCYAVQYSDSTEWMVCEATKSGQAFFLPVEKTGQDFVIDGQIFPCATPPEQAAELSDMMVAIGKAVNMSYKPGGSGATNKNTMLGLKQFFGYDNDMFLASPDAYSDRQWHAMVQEELLAGRPVYYTGGDITGHAFVIDGMQGDEDGTTYYHVNWGWDGLCNGYYLLNMLRPVEAGTGGTSGRNYSISAAMLVGMIPDDGIAQPLTLAACGLETKADEVFPEQTLSSRLQRLVVESAQDCSGNLRLSLHATGGQAEQAYVVYDELEKTIRGDMGLTNYTMRCRIPADVPAGTYELRLTLTGDGDTPGLKMDGWPQLTVKSRDAWSGGSKTTPAHTVAVCGLQLVAPADEADMVTLGIDSLLNIYTAPLEGELALIVCTADGQMLMPMEGGQAYEASSNVMYRQQQLKGQFSQYLPDGDYLLTIGMLPAGSQYWTYACRMHPEGSVWWSSFSPLFFPMTVAGGHAIIDGVEYAGADIPLTGIHSLSADSGHGVWYDLRGRPVTDAPRRGIYIKDSKKIIRR